MRRLAAAVADSHMVASTVTSVGLTNSGSWLFFQLSTFLLCLIDLIECLYCYEASWKSGQNVEGMTNIVLEARDVTPEHCLDNLTYRTINTLM